MQRAAVGACVQPRPNKYLFGNIDTSHVGAYGAPLHVLSRADAEFQDLFTSAYHAPDIGALVYKIDAKVQKLLDIQGLAIRPSEAAEMFYVLFMLFYMILITRRIATRPCSKSRNVTLA